MPAVVCPWGQSVDPSEPPREGIVVDRRKFLTSVVVAAPTLTVVGRWATGTAVGQEIPDLSGLPGILTGGPIPSPTPSDLYDLGDALVQTSTPTMGLLTLTITEEGRAAFRVPRQEVGQGVRTMCAMFIAEELEIPIEQVDVTLEDARLELLTNQLTGGSYNARALYQPVSRMAATAREQLAAIAAEQMGVPRARLVARDGQIVDPASGIGIPYGSLTQAGLVLARPQDTTPAKPVAEHRLLGTRQARTDAADIATGAKRYTLDLAEEVLPDAVPTVVLHGPQIRSSLVSLDNESFIRSLPGVIDVTLTTIVPTLGIGEDPQYLGGAPTGIAIAAETFGHAIAAQAQVEATWNAGPVAGYDDARFREELRSAAIPQLPAALPGTKVIEMEFDFAHVAHAPMETFDALATVTDDGVEVWAGMKVPQNIVEEIAETLGVLPTQVTAHCVDAGGSFGRRLFGEVVVEAAQASQAFGFPVKMMWTRDQDTKHDRLRPSAYVTTQAMHRGSQFVSYQHRYSGGETSLTHGFGDVVTAAALHFPPAPIVAGQIVFHTQMVQSYNFGPCTQLLHETDFNMLTGSWRSVYTGIGKTADEVMCDQMAAAVGEDPVEFRIRHAKSDRLREVIEWVRDNGGWGRTMPEGTAQGFAANSEHRGYQACLVEVDMHAPRYDEDGTMIGRRPRVTRAVMAFDAGIPFNVSGLEGQMLGGLADGIAMVLQAGIHIDDGAVRESTFNDYYFTRADDYPREVITHVFPARGDGVEPSGAGECMVPTTAGAIANAIGRATGTPVTSFPINF